MSEHTVIIRKQTRLGRFYDSYSKLPPVFIDGVICTLVAFLTFWNTFFGGDEAAKFVAYVVLFWLKGITGSVTITLIQLQSFRSRQYAAHMDAKEKQKVANDTEALPEAIRPATPGT